MTVGCEMNKKSDGKGDICPLVGEAADHAVRKVFAILGVDIDKPESVENFREDLRFGKRMRRASDHGQLILVGAFVGGIAMAIWSGIQTLLHTGAK